MMPTRRRNRGAPAIYWSGDRLCTDEYELHARRPDGKSPETAIRRGSITHHLSEDVPEKVVSDRMNVSLDVLEKHMTDVKNKRRQNNDEITWMSYYDSFLLSIVICGYY